MVVGRVVPRGRNAQADDPGHALGCDLGQRPHDERAPVVPDEHRAFLAQVVEQAQQVVGEVVDVVGVDRLGTARPPVATLVERHGPVPLARQGGDLVPPRVRQVGEAVGQHDGEALARLEDVQLDVAGDDSPGARLGPSVVVHPRWHVTVPPGRPRCRWQSP
jgi:hypothetical protein